MKLLLASSLLCGLSLANAARVEARQEKQAYQAYTIDQPVSYGFNLRGVLRVARRRLYTFTSHFP